MHRCRWMEMAADFAGDRSGPRGMAEDEASQRKLRGEPAAQLSGRRRIVIAGDPQPVAAGGKLAEALEICSSEPLIRRRVMEAVAEADRQLRLATLHQSRKTRKRRSRVIGRQQRAVTGEARAFLEVEIGDDDRAPGWPKKSAARI